MTAIVLKLASLTQVDVGSLDVDAEIILKLAPVLRGPGVPVGGTLRQALLKASGADFDTEWATLAKTDVGLGNVDNTSDVNKPVSTAQALADAAVLSAAETYAANLLAPTALNVFMTNWFNTLPTALPGNAGVLWNNGGVLSQS